MNGHANYSRATNAYRSAAVTVSPLGKVVMLYDGVIVSLRRAAAAVDRKCPEDAFNNLHDATTILRGLCHSLNFERGGQFAERMRDTYISLIMSALNSLGKPDAVARLNKLINAVTELRDAWAELRVRQVEVDRAKS
ncbi:MAG: flagellar protein FliS [Rhodopseudomonas sp.]|nr:flagellar protein FliS [Rhodopseudomonas sp.]